MVAEQIRTLANQSRESTERINQLVADLMDKANVSVEITEKVSEAVSLQNEEDRSDKGDLYNIER